MLNQLFANPFSFAVWAAALVVAITIHEFAHAFSADRLGDPTPRLMGRLTLNPLAHLDPLGTLMLLLVRFGWGKPVQFDPYNLRYPRRDAAIISFAGPASNIILATLLALMIRFSATFVPTWSPQIGLILQPFIFLNVILAIFNLLPIHPLDGGKVLVGLLPPAYAFSVDRALQQYGLLLLIFLIFPWFGFSPVAAIILPLVNFILNLLLPGATLI